MSPRRGRRGKRQDPEEHENHERWMVTYADMVTLLMVLFIVLFSMSQVDQKKYQALKNGLADGFGPSSSFMKGSDSVLEGDLKQASDPQLDGTDIFATLSVDQRTMLTEALNEERSRSRLEAIQEARRELDKLKQAEAKIKRALVRLGLERDVSTAIDERGLVVSLVSRHVVFRANIAQLSPRGQQVVDTLAPVLKDLGNNLRIDGHTNQAPGRPKYYATDWDLSATRAIEVLRRLEEVNGIRGERLSVAAYGHEKPLLDPSRPNSQAINKRVDIVVLPKLDTTSLELLDQINTGQITVDQSVPDQATDRPEGGDR